MTSQPSRFFLAWASTVTPVWLGEFGLRRAIREGSVRLQGPAGLQRRFPRWLGLSRFAGVARQAGPALA